MRGRIAALRKAWKIPDDARIVLAPGRVAPWNGQLMLPAVARALRRWRGARHSSSSSPARTAAISKYARAVLEQAQAQGVQPLFRLIGHCRDMPAAFAAADVVVVPAIAAAGARPRGGARRKPWAGRWSPPTSAFCRSMW